MWTHDDAINFIKELTPIIKDAGYALGLTGSILIKETSEKDLDIIVYPLTKGKQDLPKLYEIFKEFGMERHAEVGVVLKFWHSKGSIDTKHVEIWKTSDKKRVDFFFLS